MALLETAAGRLFGSITKALKIWFHLPESIVLTSALPLLPSSLWSSVKGWHSLIVKVNALDMIPGTIVGQQLPVPKDRDTGVYASGNKGVGVPVISPSIQIFPGRLVEDSLYNSLYECDALGGSHNELGYC